METRLINPNDCKCIQSRVLLDPATVQEYANMMGDGVAFDPCKAIITPSGKILVYDGNHRVEAAKTNGSMVEIELTRGTEPDAQWLAYNANTRHGLKRSADDIAKIVEDALRHPHALGKSDRELARHCGCDHKTIGKYRKQLEASGERPQMQERTVTRNGTEYQMSIPEPEPEAVAHTPAPIKPLAPVILTAGHWSISIPNDIEIGRDDELFAHSPLGAKFKSRAEEWEQNAIIRTWRRMKGLPERQKIHNAQMLTFRIMFDADHESEQINISLRVRDMEPLPLPFLDDVAEGKGLCDACEYASSIHYLNENGRKWCTLSILRNEYLKQYLKPEKITVYETITHPKPKKPTCAGCGNIITAGAENAEYDDDGRPYHPMCLYRVTHQKEIAAWYSGEDDNDALSKDDDDEETCWFCGNDFPVSELYRDPEEAVIASACLICRSCASKAMHALLDPSDPAIIATTNATEQAWSLEDGRNFEMNSVDRNKIIHAGLRLFRGSEIEKVLKQYTKAHSTSVGGVDIAWGSWKIAERFETKKALKERIKELEQEPDVVIDGRS